MIIQCINCSKKFKVDPALVPKDGRSIQCGACNHTWFYSPSTIFSTDILIEKDVNELSQKNKTVKKKEDLEKTDYNNEKVNNNNYTPQKVKKETNKAEVTTKSVKISYKFDLIKILSFIIVLIISFIGIIIFLDTFKSTLSNFYPGLELLLYNLFESVKDIDLFIKDLI